MTLSIYLLKKLIKALIICGVICFSVFFIFSLIGNLGEKISFKLILLLSAINSIQIFTYIPSHLFILSLCIFVINLKMKNELVIIKEYVGLKFLYSVISSIILLFIIFELNKNALSKNLEIVKKNLINNLNLKDTKIFINSDEDKTTYKVFIDLNYIDNYESQYLEFHTFDRTIYKGVLSTDVYINKNDLYSRQLTIYENNHFQNEYSNKVIYKNFKNYWPRYSDKVIKSKSEELSSNYGLIQSTIFHTLFYLIISLIFFSKRFVNREINISKFFFIIISIFLYYLIIPKIIINNFDNYFQIITIIIFILVFLNFKKYE